ncbi:MAG: hypothetical protein E6K53_15360 [Gammaproteobacteria bacterium]|nr:MAG: hypothetical protein E6K53_15360 [Gammaproteobacteria bacterium]
MPVTVGDVSADTRRCVPPRQQHELSRFERGEIAAFPIGSHEVLAAHAERHHARDLRNPQRAIDPGTAVPARRKAHPVGMVVDMHDRKRCGDGARGAFDDRDRDVMEIA